MDSKLKYYLEIADNAFILSHRLGECCSKGPFLEEDLATTNVALDLIGLAENVYNEAAKIEGLNRSGDHLAFRRDETDYYNCLLVEQPNVDFAHIIVRQFFMDTFNYYFFSELSNSTDAFLKEVSIKTLKEIAYHLRRSSEWMVRFGNGTEESKMRASKAIQALWRYTDELFEESEACRELLDDGISVDLSLIRPKWDAKVNEVFYLSRLSKPENEFQISGGKRGKHSEYMGYILAELQFLNIKYPDAVW